MHLTVRLAIAVAAAAVAATAAPSYGQTTNPSYRDAVLSSPGLRSYWRLGETSGSSAADENGVATGTYAGGPLLGRPGALSFDPDRSARFDGTDDFLEVGDPSLALSASGTLEGWFFWESGVALMRDATTGGGWIIAFDSGGRVAYRVGGTTFTTSLATSSLRDAWHHIVLSVSGGTATLYVDGNPVHTGTAAGATAAVMPWRVMRNGANATQFTRGRADEVAIYTGALSAATVRQHFEAGRDLADTEAPAAPTGLTARAGLGRVTLDWADGAEPDLDGYDVYRATSPGGPYARANPSRLSESRYVDTGLAGGTTYYYVVTASDTENNRSSNSSEATATPPSTDDLLRQYAPHLKYESQETYFADSAGEMTDNYVAGKRTNYLLASGGTRIAAADPANALPDLSLAFLGDPTYANGRAAAATDYLDAANGYHQQDAQRLRSNGYADRAYGRVVTAQGKTWLQYWLFYYYNPQNVLGFGVHEGDWEFVQVGLDADGRPDVATYAQHSDGERCGWSALERTGTGAPVIYVAQSSHASYFGSGINPRGVYPDDYHRGNGYQVRPALEIVRDTSPGWIAWRGRWGASSSSPPAPRRQSKWSDPTTFNANARDCTISARAARSGQRPRRSGASNVVGPDAPAVRLRRSGAAVEVSYRVPSLPRDRRRRPVNVLATVTVAGRLDEVSGRLGRLRGRRGRVTLSLPRSSSRRYIVRVAAFSRRGSRSRVVTAPLR